jgi:S-formylglutathione hydrolase FrmB
MVLAEIPGWLEQRGFGAARRALWGWSMGGYGSMRIAQVSPGWARAVAAFSPAVRPGDSVFDAAEALSATPLGIWCGTKDRFYDATRALVEVLPRPPAIAVFGPGGHTRSYWSEHTLRAFRFLSGHLQG